MPELPEVEITARRIGAATAGAIVESTLAPGLNALKTYDPPLSILEGRRIAGVRRRGKLFLLDLEDELTLLIHLMSAGRLQLFETRASLRDRTSRFLLRLGDGSELRLREFGTKQRAWVKLLRAGDVETDETLLALGPEAWPDPPPFAWLEGAISTASLMVAASIFITQRREDVLAGHRAQLLLELLIVNDRKIAKIIELIEEVRRDTPTIRDRVDGEAASMATPSDPHAVLQAIKDVVVDGKV